MPMNDSVIVIIVLIDVRSSSQESIEHIQYEKKNYTHWIFDIIVLSFYIVR